MIYCLPAIIRIHYTQLFSYVHQNVVDEPGGADFDSYSGEDFAGDFIYALKRLGIDNADIFDLSRWNLMQYCSHLGNDLVCFRCAGFDHPSARLK